MAVPVRALADLRRCKVNAGLLGRDLHTDSDRTGCHRFYRETIEIGDSRAHARMFAPADNIPEDPATGSACGALGAYLVHHGVSGVEPKDGKFKFVIEQGDFIHRPSRMNLEVKGEAGAVEQVRVGGPSVVVAKRRSDVLKDAIVQKRSNVQCPKSGYKLQPQPTSSQGITSMDSEHWTLDFRTFATN